MLCVVQALDCNLGRAVARHVFTSPSAAIDGCPPSSRASPFLLRRTLA